MLKPIEVGSENDESSLLAELVHELWDAAVFSPM
jgi:hypothetical protein